MKTMRAKSIFGVAVVFLAICSCDKSEFTIHEGKSSSKPIMIGKVEVGAPLTKSHAPESSQVGEVNDGNVTFTVTETVSAIESDYQTKATAITTASLESFKVYGYLDPEIKDKEGASDYDKEHLYFIQGAEAGKNSIQNSRWWGDFGTTYNWRFGVHHHFWATPNDISLSIDQDTFDSASFSYTSDGTKDVVIAYSNQYFGKDEETALKDSTMHLTFKHALAAIKINSENLVFLKRKSGETDEAVGNYPSTSSTPRCEILKYEVRGLADRGDCAVDRTTAFTWSNHSSSVNPAIVNLLADNEPQFLIPQDRSGALLHLEIIDRQRQLTRPFIYELKNVFGTSEWLAGHQYSYQLKGSIIVPKLPENQEGIDVAFTGKGFKSLSVIQDVPGKYISKIKLSWEGVVAANPGNGTYYMISIEPKDSTDDPSETYLSYVDDPALLKQHHIGFCVDHKAVSSGTDGLLTYHTAANNLSYVGSYDPDDYKTAAGKERLAKVECWCIIDVPEDMQDFHVYAVYNGGQGGSCDWQMNNVKLEVLEWR